MLALHLHTLAMHLHRDGRDMDVVSIGITVRHKVGLGCCGCQKNLYFWVINEQQTPSAMKVQATKIKAGMTFKYGNTPVRATVDAYTIGKEVFVDCVDLPYTVKHRGVPPMVFKGGSKTQARFRASTMVEVR